MNSLRISSCVLTYNGKDRVIPTLESLKLQTYPYKDLVIADDASTDCGCTVSIVEEWLKHNSEHFTNVKFIKNPHNLGIVANIKNAVSYTEGEIIFLLGQGDMCYGPDTFELIAKSIGKERSSNIEVPQIWIGYYRSYSLTPRWHTVDSIMSLPFQINKLKDRNTALKALIRGNFIGAPSLVYTKQLFLNYPPIPEEIRDCEDFPLLLYHISNNIKFGKLDFFIRWYEAGVGISYNQTEVYKQSIMKMNRFIINSLKNNKELINEIKKYKYTHKVIYRIKKMPFKSKLKAIALNFCHLKFIIPQRICNFVLKITYIPVFTHITKKKSGKCFMNIFY